MGDQGFRSEIRDWLRTRLEGGFAEVCGTGGPGREHEALDARIAWEQELGHGGWIGMAWPREAGGRDRPAQGDRSSTTRSCSVAPGGSAAPASATAPFLTR